MKKVLAVSEAPRPHWVGDGFHVHSMFSYTTHGGLLSPFLLLDYAAPEDFTPTTRRRGVGEHPHRGFETVTIVYKGEVSHRDSTGKGGTIGPGDVQWMTAASGILHEEFHSEAFARSGGPMHMVQLWVNLPAKDKMAAPGYQAIGSGDIPSVDFPGEAGRVRVIAGEFAGARGPARTFTPMNVWDLSLKAGGEASFQLPDGWNTALIVLGGEVEANGAAAREAQMVLLDPKGTGLTVKSKDGATLLLLSGEPIHEPIAGYGPFVMNTEAEIEKAIVDFNSGHFGEIPR
ncbi:MAG TPA: pirin family protein [Holophagaceae bacterium]|nr:pirin family protein [Holophagaceae bacterium]